MIETRPPAHPWCTVISDAKSWPGVIVQWERGHSPWVSTWMARVVYVKHGEPVTELVPPARVRRAV